mmetsp:Transcript_15277/g.45619  ORF Transcript_15277/g.45619 Transcript_15277/m.45619 type:complete len:719 (+) Transcript_15277:121-2277(+)|eukprot:CAMPEP_0119273124 /NCGR_PEP_ID=MMETSP1329-20130426/9718_1 /TAXON_ID=114041 /ORGANISM="Genus nov. species nov., Strain RCC1024" /LENGTH=718 /DNA_ID=CAMNT_0007273299 /DNA_START=89 /DNA_END=2245 /DNA_ORIENTATION=+
MADVKPKNYAEIRRDLKEFLLHFRDPSCSGGEQHKYTVALQAIHGRQGRALVIELDDLIAYFKGPEITNYIISNAMRFLTIFDTIATEILQQMESCSAPRAMEMRGKCHMSSSTATAANDIDVPPALSRKHETFLLPPSKTPIGSLRGLRASGIGSLVKVRGIVTRASDVKPLVEVITYTCESCGYEIYHDISKKREYLPLTKCTSQRCGTNGRSGRLFAQSRGSKFVKYQELRLQELPVHVPVGHVPRSITVHCRGELTRHCAPGDTVTISGIFLPQHLIGTHAPKKAGLISDTFLEAMSVQKDKKGYSELEGSRQIDALIDEIADSSDAYSRLARSIAPEIFGHEDIKRALLLQLVGGVTQTLGDGVRLRGDINICLMGDPGVAKSQLLKSIASTSPRGVYTTGKGSSGVGLTAAIIRDATTSEMSLEGGALVLADCGVCCIDEFDKMDERDRTAIHEVMEQQTVSIAKAGITTTLNARTAVLAAANPLFGRYNNNKSISENINLPNSLLSRFDLLFLLLDRPDIEADVALARHITHVHRFLSNPGLDFEPYDSVFIRQYVAQARQFQPVVPPKLSGTVIDSYVDRRQAAAERGQVVATPRQLLSILRLSQALARLRFDDVVNQDDINEASRLTDISTGTLDSHVSVQIKDPKSKAFSMLCDYASQQGKHGLSLKKIKDIAIKNAIREHDLLAMLQEYEELGILFVSSDNTHVDFC